MDLRCWIWSTRSLFLTRSFQCCMITMVVICCQTTFGTQGLGGKHVSHHPKFMSPFFWRRSALLLQEILRVQTCGQIGVYIPSVIQPPASKLSWNLVQVTLYLSLFCWNCSAVYCLTRKECWKGCSHSHMSPSHCSLVLPNLSLFADQPESSPPAILLSHSVCSMCQIS